jgi:hypothetical protein
MGRHGGKHDLAGHEHRMAAAIRTEVYGGVMKRFSKRNVRLWNTSATGRYAGQHDGLWLGISRAPRTSHHSRLQLITFIISLAIHTISSNPHVIALFISTLRVSTRCRARHPSTPPFPLNPFISPRVDSPYRSLRCCDYAMPSFQWSFGCRLSLRHIPPLLLLHPLITSQQSPLPPLTSPVTAHNHNHQKTDFPKHPASSASHH